MVKLESRGESFRTKNYFLTSFFPRCRMHRCSDLHLWSHETPRASKRSTNTNTFHCSAITVFLSEQLSEKNHQWLNVCFLSVSHLRSSRFCWPLQTSPRCCSPLSLRIPGAFLDFSLRCFLSCWSSPSPFSRSLDFCLFWQYTSSLIPFTFLTVGFVLCHRRKHQWSLRYSLHQHLYWQAQHLEHCARPSTRSCLLCRHFLK